MQNAAHNYASTMLRPFLRTIVLFALMSLLVAASHACSVPVFRYALEHWDAAPFDAFVFHRGPLGESERAAMRDLGEDGLAGKLHANVAVHDVDLAQDPAAELVEMWTQSADGKLPWIVAKFPATNRGSHIFWSAPFTADSAAQLLDSPARKEIIQRLGEGQSAVWLLLESGDAAKDSAAADLLEARLKHLASVLQLPKLDAQDIANGLVSTGQDGLHLEFSTLRIRRGDVAEQALIRMLLGAETDLAETKNPLVVPVFGQGRALYALVGDGIKTEAIDKAATFLIGKCSCEVKERNPGFDLLLAADWKALLAAQNAGIPDLPTMAELTKSAPVTVTISPDSAPAQAGVEPRQEKPEPPPWLMPVLAGTGVLALLAIVRIFTRK